MGKGEKTNEAPHNGGMEELLRRTAKLHELEAEARQLGTERERLLEKLKQVNEQLLISSLSVQEKAEEVAQEHNKLLTVVNIMDDEVWFVDTQCRISMVNDAAAKAHGYRSVADIQRVPMTEKWLSEFGVCNSDGTLRSYEETPLLRSLQGETVRGAEEIVRHPKTGQMRRRIVNSAPVMSPEGQIIGAIAVVRDIGEYEVVSKPQRER